MTRSAHFGSWWDLAACQHADPELFFPVSQAGPAQLQQARAKAVCAGCAVSERCLDYAMETNQAHGVWGGLGEDERRRLRVVLMTEPAVTRAS